MSSSNKYKGKLGKTLFVLSIVPSILVYGAVSSSASGPKSVNPEHPVISSITTTPPVAPTIIDCNTTSSPVSAATPMPTPSTSDSSTPAPVVSIAPTNNHDSGIENGCDIPEPIACNLGAVPGSPGPLTTPTDAPSVDPSAIPVPRATATPTDAPTPGVSNAPDQNGRDSGECLPPPPGCIINLAPPAAGHPIIQKGLPTVKPSASSSSQKGKGKPIIQKGSPKGKPVKPSAKPSPKSSEKPLTLPPLKPTLSPLPKPSISGGSQGSNEDNGSKCEPHNPGGPVESQGGKGKPLPPVSPNPQASQNGSGSSDSGLGELSCAPSSNLKGSGKPNQPQAPQPQPTSSGLTPPTPGANGNCPPPPPLGGGPVGPIHP